MNNHGLSLKFRLFAGFSVMLLVIGAIALTTWSTSRQVGALSAEMSTKNLPQQQKMQSVLNNINLIARVLRHVQIVGNANEKDALAAADELRKVVAAREQIQKTLDEVDALSKQYNDDESLRDVAVIREKRQAYVEEQKKFIEAFNNHKPDLARQVIIGGLRETYLAYQGEIEKVTHKLEKRNQVLANNLHTLQDKAAATTIHPATKC